MARTRSRSRSSKKSKSSKKSTPKKRRSKSKSRCRSKCKASKPSDYNDPKAVFFPGINKIPYKGPKSKDPMVYKYYNANEVILGRKMKDWCRFSVV